MARIRTVKPEFWADEKLGQISRDARLLFIGLFNLSDDFGVCKGHISWIKSQLFPYDDLSMRKFQSWLNQLVDRNFITPFNQNGEKFLYIQNFNKHQVINRPSKQRNPEPPKGIESSVNPHGVLTVGREGKGKEGKGKEGNGREEESEEKPKTFSLSKGKEKAQKKWIDPNGMTFQEKADRYRSCEEEKARQLKEGKEKGLIQ